ncbi:MAG: dual specificity protein phosphatase family protein [Rivularia sp. (in: Bacteria)]|nr:dual specificity protein phosphatase family protein [Rivularia sp. MS3]
MKYALVFYVLGILLIIFSCNKFDLILFNFIIFWCGLSFLTLGIAYGGLGARVFGKQKNGKISKFSFGFLLPYLLLTWAVWHIQRLISKEDCCNQIIPGIWLGRRVYVNELPKNISLIVDLTAEFSEPINVISGKTYICIPTLDTDVPSERAFYKLIETISNWKGNIYIHCALGHGRSATVVAGVLIVKGLVNNLEEAEKLLKTVRPKIKFSQAQKKLLNNFKF